ncbi:MAG: HAD family hydrolase [Parvibaculum sp.]
MVLVFDLDDTLYEERSYVESGLKAVALRGEAQFGWDADVSFRFMMKVLDSEGRGAIFDRWLQVHGRYSKTLVDTFVRHYRHHVPRLKLDPHAEAILPRLKDYPLYIVTDGHKIVQQLKVEALGIAPLFRRVFITHRHGIARAKPSTYCFERILSAERCDWSDLTYVGDNPAKDFVALNREGAHTVRVLTGMHRDVKAAPGYEAEHHIAHLGEFPELLPKLEGKMARDD